MAYQSRHTGAEIDEAIDLINQAVRNEQAWYNKEIAITNGDWGVAMSGSQGKYVFTTPYEAFSNINKFPSVYFVRPSGIIYDLPVKFNSTTNPTSISVYSNVVLYGTLVICSNSGHLEN